MACEYCLGSKNNHDYRCPNYVPPYSKYKCELCHEGIYNDEKYIFNQGFKGNKYVHYECALQNPDWLINFLNIEIETMRD